PKHGINRSDNETNDVFALLRRIPVENQYRHFADSILTRFQTIQQPLSSSNWTDLMVRINSDRFVLNILEKTKSVKTYFNWITKTLELCAQVNDFRNKFQFDFDERMGNDFETTDNIEINDEEILQDTFHTPNRSSFTYSVLFEDCFQTSKVRKKVVDRLIIQLNTWEEQGLRANEIRQWNNYADDQREVARRIWNCVYDRGSLESELPVDELDNHVPLVSDSSESNVVVRNLWTLDGDRAVSTDNLHEITTTSVAMDTEDTEFKVTQKSCLSILEKAAEIRGLFSSELEQLCLKWKELPISYLSEMFSNMQTADQDLQTLTPLLDRAVIPDLKKLIEYWKIHERIAHIHQGSINVLKHLQGQTTDEPSSPLKAALNTTQEPSGAACYEAYENYCINYSQHYSDDALKLIAQYSSSAELLIFVHSLSENEGDSLLEAVNDFDETLTDTKTMVDFAVLKTFIDRAYANIKRAKRETTATPLSLEDVISAFQILMNESEFKNILECFESCSKSLESIKRIHGDSTNKGQSKRKRIFDIMADSSFTFIHESINVSGQVHDRFDIKSQKQSMRYDDLSELRDRARLIEYSNNKIKNETDREIEELHMFVTLVDTIETILNILTSLYMAGHPYVPEFLASRKVFEYDSDSLESELPVDELDDHVSLVSELSEPNVVVSNLWTLDGG
ncbi:unnamed protein product, partial [Rotaria sp. Silwood1]